MFEGSKERSPQQLVHCCCAKGPRTSHFASYIGSENIRDAQQDNLACPTERFRLAN